MTNYIKNPTWADGSGGGTAITAAKLNNIESGIYDAHFAPAARVYRTSNQSINDSTLTAIAFDSEAFDTDTIHDTVSNTERLTCKTAGKYQINGTLLWASNAVGYRSVYIYLNGAATIAVQQGPTISGISVFQTVSTIYDLAVNDYVELRGFQTSGGALNVTFQTGLPAFQMARVA